MSKCFNFLVIVVDDLGFFDIGVFGGEIVMLNFDVLVIVGLCLIDFYIVLICLLICLMLFIGIDYYIVGIGIMVEVLILELEGKLGYEGYFNECVVVLLELFCEVGYQIFMVGKWYFGLKLEQMFYVCGFECFFLLLLGVVNYYGFELFYDESILCIFKGMLVFYVEDECYFDMLLEGFYFFDVFGDKLL